MALPHLELTPRVHNQVRLERVLGSVAQISGKVRESDLGVESVRGTQTMYMERHPREACRHNTA
jgi:hypothetical protein